MKKFFLFNFCLLTLLGAVCRAAESDAKPLRVGIIGLDTSHVIAFTKLLNDPQVSEALAGCPVVAAYPQGSPDIESSASRIPKYTAEIRELGVEIVNSIDALLARVDVVLLETNDGRSHLQQVLPVLRAGKPVFVDKPVAGSLADAVAIYDEASRLGVPLFSASSLRFSREIQEIQQGAVGEIIGCDAYSPCPLEPTHPDLFWYGIHGVETLFTIMGPGCQRVTRTKTLGTDFVVGEWKEDRVGTFRGIRDGRRGTGGTAFGTKGIRAFGRPDLYQPLLLEIVKFFRTGKPPVSAEETLEIFAFMEAADESERQGGISVTIDSVLKRARAKAKKISIVQKHDSLALTPPMGWNSWNCFREDVSAEKVKSIADALVSSGMKEAGYEYVVIDDGWMTKERDEEGHIIVDPVKFPNGMKAVADYLHSRGLKFGIYSAPGRYTCQKLMGSLGHEQLDANDYAAWGVDYLKYDWCHYPKTTAEAKETSRETCRKAFERMRDCLAATGRPILYSVHEGCSRHTTGEHDALPWIKNVAHMCRTGSDIKDNWDRMLYCLEMTAPLWEHAGPGFWNDPDMLEVGNTTKERLWGGISDVKMNLEEYRAHFSMWCMVSAPLIAGNDVRNMTEEITEIFTNQEVIAIDQDPLGKQGRRIRQKGDLEVWCKPLSGGRKAVALFNRGSTPADISVHWQELGLKGKMQIRDLWEHKNLGEYEGSFTGRDIPSHELLLILLSK